MKTLEKTVIPFQEMINGSWTTTDIQTYEWEHDYEGLKLLAIAELKKAFIIMEKSLTKYFPHKIPELKKVTFKIVLDKRSKRTLGTCWYGKGHIEIYPNNFTFKENADFIDTLLHEYAHYLNYMVHGKTGHNSTWRKLCEILGCNPRATSSK